MSFSKFSAHNLSFLSYFLSKEKTFSQVWLIRYEESNDLFKLASVGNTARTAKEMQRDQQECKIAKNQNGISQQAVWVKVKIVMFKRKQVLSVA